jgi:hypothetical protein
MPNINRLYYTDILQSSHSYWKILKLTVPVGLETIFQTLFGLIDQVIVGLLGAGAVAGIGLANSVSFRRFGKRLRQADQARRWDAGPWPPSLRSTISFARARGDS